MHYSNRLAVCVVATLLSISLTASQSTPQLIRLQGFLRDTSGGGGSVPATGDYDMTFTLYDSQFGGVEVNTVVKQQVPVLEGLYTVQLEFVSADFDGTERWIEISIATAGGGVPETLTPRIRMVSAPFAYRAETLDGYEGSELDESSEIAASEANLQSQIDNIEANIATAGNSLDEAYDQGGAGAGRTIVADAGPVSIDGDGLDVHGSDVTLRDGGRLRVTNPANPSASVNLSYFNDGVEDVPRIRVSGMGEGSRGFAIQGPSNTTYLRIDQDGRFGIGTDSPEAVLHIPNNNDHNLLQLGRGKPWTSVSWRKSLSFSGSNTSIAFDPGGDTHFGIGASNSANSLMFWSNQGGGTANAPNYGIVMREDGNVGIGVTNPQQRLVVNGTTRTDVLRIDGGADLAEPFEVSSGTVPAGSLMVIDDNHPGQLALSNRPYDRRVAGIISGAGGVQPGITLGLREELGDGPLVAMAGRVYCRATTSNGAIRPGDLLTTSGTPGHAMRVTHGKRSRGAVVGKAMTALTQGEGLVLVLVDLQ